MEPQLRKITFVIGGLGVLASILIAIWVSYTVFQDPGAFLSLPIDQKWAALYAILLAGVGLGCWIGRGRWLLFACLITVAALFLIPILLAGIAKEFTVFLWSLLAAYSLGDWLLARVLGKQPRSLLERIALAFTLGMASLMVLVTALGFLQLYTRIVGFSLLLLVTLGFSPRVLRCFYVELSTRLTIVKHCLRIADLRGQALVYGVFLILLLGSYLWALSPSIRFDALSYHLVAPDYYIRHGGIVQVPEAGSTIWAHYAETLYTLGLLLAGQPLPSMFHLSMGLVTILFCFLVGRRLAGKRGGWLAALLLFSVPLVGYEIGTPYIDFFVCAYTTALGFSILIWWMEDQDRWLWLVGIFAGMALGIKLTAATFVVSALAGLLILLLIRRGVRYTVYWCFILAGVILVLLIPWLIRDGLWTGDPIAPFGRTLLSRYTQSSVLQKDTPQNTSGSLILNFIQYPLRLVMDSHAYYQDAPGGMLAALPLLALPWLYLSYSCFSRTLRRTMAWILAAQILVVLLLFVAHTALARYIAPSLPWMAVGGALNLEAIISAGETNHWRKTWVILGLILGLVYVLFTRLAFTVISFEVPERYPYRVVLGRESQEEYLARTLPVFSAYRFLDGQDSGPHRVFSLGNEFRYYTNAQIDGLNDSPAARWVAEAATQHELASRMAYLGYDYILINEPTRAYKQNIYGLPLLDQEFLNRYTRLEYVERGIYLYRFYPDGAPLSQEPTNLLKNEGFETYDSQDHPVNWRTYGVVYLEKGARAKQGFISLRLHGPLSAESYGSVYQQVPVEEKILYTAGYWVDSDKPVTFALQICWLDANRQTLDRDLEWEITRPGWNLYQISAMAPQGAVFAEIYASVANDDIAWFDDLCFAVGQTCR
jgi:hypothetical protein